MINEYYMKNKEEFCASNWNSTKFSLFCGFETVSGSFRYNKIVRLVVTTGLLHTLSSSVITY
jgi:hypothetical protein